MYLSVIAIDLVTDDDEREINGLARSGLYEEHVIPTVQLPK